MLLKMSYPYGENFRPSLLRVLDVLLDGRRGSVKVEDDVPVVLVLEPPLHDLADAPDPLPHGHAGHAVEELGELAE